MLHVSVCLSVCLPACLPVCLSVRTEQLGFHWKDSNDLLHFRFFRKYVEKIQV